MKNIMYLLDIEKADDVDVYYDSDDSDYDDGEPIRQYLPWHLVC